MLVSDQKSAVGLLVPVQLLESTATSHLLSHFNFGQRQAAAFPVHPVFLTLCASNLPLAFPALYYVLPNTPPQGWFKVRKYNANNVKSSRQIRLSQHETTGIH